MKVSRDALVYAKIRELYQHPTKLFPTQQPQSLLRRNLDTVFSANYCVSQKSDGQQMTLLIAHVGRIGPVCCLMDRREVLYYYEISCPEEYFAGTLIIGEKIGNLFLAFDTVAYCGGSLLLQDYRTRLSASDRFAAAVGTTIKFMAPAFEFRTKPCYATDTFLEEFVAVSADDGLIFMPLADSLTRAIPFKWKAKHTVDLVVEARRFGDSFQYLVIEPQGIEAMGRIDQSSALLTTAEDLLRGSTLDSYRVVVECLFTKDSIGSKFVPVRFRHDKLLANQAATVFSTILCCEENITLDELVERFQCLAPIKSF